MPQVYMVVAPRAQKEVNPLLSGFGTQLIKTTELVFNLEGEDDVTFTAMNAVCVLGDADIQVEVRYTVGEDEYNRGEPFRPSKEQMEELSWALQASIQQYLQRHLPEPEKVLSSSVWIIPYEGTVFGFEL